MRSRRACIDQAKQFNTLASLHQRKRHLISNYASKGSADQAIRSKWFNGPYGSDKLFCNLFYFLFVEILSSHSGCLQAVHWL